MLTIFTGPRCVCWWRINIHRLFHTRPSSHSTMHKRVHYSLHVHCNSHTLLLRKCWHSECLIYSAKSKGKEKKREKKGQVFLAVLSIPLLPSPLPPSLGVPCLPLAATLPLWLHFFLCHGVHCYIYLRFTAHTSSIHRGSAFMQEEAAHHQIAIGIKWAFFIRRISETILLRSQRLKKQIRLKMA